MVLHGHVTWAATLNQLTFRILQKVFGYTHFDWCFGSFCNYYINNYYNSARISILNDLNSVDRTLLNLSDLYLVNVLFCGRPQLDGDMVKHELRVACYELRVTSWKIKSTCWYSKVQVEIQEWEFKSTSYEFESTSYEFKSASYEFKSTSYEFESMSYEFESTS